MKLPPYPRYKPSDVEWLGNIPEHWDTWKATHGFRKIGSGTTPKSGDTDYYDGDIPWVTTSELRENVIMDTAAKVTAAAIRDYPTLRLYPKGTLLFAMYGATIGRLGILGIPAVVNQACAAFAEPQTLDTMFTYYWLQMRRPTLIVLSAGGSQPNLSQDDLRQLRIPAPEPSEQRAIAKFLYSETAKIDALVAKKRTLIERLKEKRSALISRTVTRGLPPEAAHAAGLNPQPKLKSSGIDWLGAVPEHWSVLRLSRVTVSRCDGPFGSGLKSEHYSQDEGIRVIRLQNVRLAEFDNRDMVFIEPDYYRELGDHDVLAGDVLIAGLGDENNPVGRACVAPPTLGPAMVKADCFRFRLDTRRAHAAYVALQLSASAIALSGALAMGTTRARMNLSATAARAIALPPLSEQVAIANFLDHERARIGEMIVKVETAVERLQEYRMALITAAVTGKIDVRGGGA